MRIGLVVNRLEDYVLPVAAGVAEVVHAHGGSLLLLVLPQGAAEHGWSWLRRLASAGTVDAVALTALVDPATGEPCTDEVLRAVGGLPAVTLGGTGRGAPDVGCDNAASATEVAHHLLGSGRRRLLLLAGPRGNPDSDEREHAFVAAVRAQGLPPEDLAVLRADFSRETAYRRTSSLLDRLAAEGASPPDAVFAANDEMAVGALDALRVRGLRVPEDVAVVGFDDTAAAAQAHPPLSSCEQPLGEQGRAAARVLLDLLAGRPVPQRTKSRSRLVLRASSAPPPSGRPAGAGVVPLVPSVPLALAEVGAPDTERLQEELLRTRGLLALNQGLLSAASGVELGDGLEALLPRTTIDRIFVARTADGAAELLHAGGRGGKSGAAGGSDTAPYRPEELLPARFRAELDRGVLVVHLLVHGDEESGVLLYEQAVLDRWTGQSLQQGLSSALAAISRTRQLTEHAARLERQVAERTAELQEANRRLQAALLADGLTGVANRVAFDEALVRLWEQHAVTGEPLTVLMGDVDHFKAYNDTAGHLAGDACLRAVASCIADAVRGGDVVARYGGEEFAVLLPGADPRAAREVAERVLARVRAAALPHPASPGRSVSLSIGAATSALPAPLGSGLELVGAADRALYRAKDGGRDRVACEAEGVSGLLA